MAAARAAERGGRVELPLLFDGFRHARKSQLALGVIYLVCLVLLLGATALVDDGALAGWMLAGRKPGDEIMQSGAFFGALAAALALYAPVMMMFWFAPPLVAWHSSPPPKALFFSLVACLLNWRAFLAYGAVTALVMLVLPFIALSIVLLASGGALKAPLMSLVFPLLILMLPTLFGSFYASYRDVFGTPSA